MTPENLREKINAAVSKSRLAQYLREDIKREPISVGELTDEIMSLIDQSKGEQVLNKIWEGQSDDFKRMLGLTVTKEKDFKEAKENQFNLKEGEQLEVNKQITRHLKGDLTIKTTYGVTFLKEDMSKSELEAFCAKHNLKVVGEA